MFDKWRGKKGWMKSALIVGGIIGLLLIPLIISFLPTVCSEEWVDPPDPHLSVTTDYPSVLNASKDYKNMRVTIQREDETYSGVNSVTIYLATETGEKLEQIGYQSKEVNYQTNLEDGTERFLGINTYSWELSGYDGDYTLKILAYVYSLETYYYWSGLVVVDYIPIEVIGEEKGEDRCFIATASYGTGTVEGLDTLRSFRDNILLTNTYGESLVDTYYSTSPPIADSLSQNEFMRDATRILLVIPATIITGIIMNPLGLVGVISAIIASILLSWKFGVLPTVSKGAGYATIVALAGIDSVLTIGWASSMWTGFSTIAIYILPIILPISIGIFIWTLKQNYYAS